ncbi:ATP-binding protein [Microbacterium luticocti]|uniref:ATP-binding protein n=1 Tax=Microbacterium luticocti TaxID=451764 RepID=UPI0004087A8B|nr:ATP-binding protein [Microbacterium luticocti]
MTTAPAPVDDTALVDRFARRRLYRLMTMSLGITAIVEAASVIPAMLTQRYVLTPALTIVALVVLVAPAVLALCLFAHARLRVLRGLWRIQALGMLVVYLAVPVVLGGTRLAEGFGLTWLGELEIVPACAAVLAWRWRGVLAYAIVWQATMFSIALLCAENPVLGRALGDALRQLFFIAMFMCLAFALLRAGRLLDTAVDVAVRESRKVAAADARRTARTRVQMLVHDRIIVALLAYAGGESPQRAREEAATALDDIRRAPHETATESTPRQLAWRLQATTTRLDPSIRFDYVATTDGDIPADVCAALEEAFAEAVRNSVRHADAGTPVTRQVRADVSADRIEVVVLDDGCGFDPRHIASTRLGVRQGIIRRMQGVPGGRADVRSTRGYGTTVTLRWERP